jgi:hypothetical protein
MEIISHINCVGGIIRKITVDSLYEKVSAMSVHRFLVLFYSSLFDDAQLTSF